MSSTRSDGSGGSQGRVLTIYGVLCLIGIAVAFALVAAIALVPIAIIWWLFSRHNTLASDATMVVAAITLGTTIVVYFTIDPRLGLTGLIVVGCAAALWYLSHPWFPVKQEYDAALSRYRTLDTVPPSAFRIAEEYLGQNGTVAQSMLPVMHAVMERLYREDYQAAPFPNLPPLDIKYRKHELTETIEKVRTVTSYREREAERAARTQQLVSDLFQVLLDAAGPLPNDGPLRVPLYQTMPDIRQVIRNSVYVLMSDQYQELQVGETSLDRYYTNAVLTSSRFRSQEEIKLRGELDVYEHPGTTEEILNDYLAGTCLADIVHLPVAYGLPEHLRAEHGVIIAGSGGGKTQLLESLILADIDDDARPGVILIDSKGEMIERLARLDVFHPETGRLRDQLIIIDHKDKPALNMFDIDEELVDSKINEVASLMRYFFGGLFGSQLSDQMDVLFLPLLHMILRMPGATLHTFAELVDNPLNYPEVVARIPEGPRSFILNHYNDRGYAQTKTGIVTRLHRIINEVTLDEMFSAPNNAIDIGQALNDGKIILVSTDADGLQDLSAIFGKYFIAQVMNAGLSRGSRQQEKRRPIHFYIDECAPYVDDKLAQMLTTIRSYGIGVMMAFQGQWQMKAFTSVIVGNTAIKILGSIEDDGDAKAFANSMRTDAAFIMAQRKQRGVGKFACYTRDLSRAIPVELPFGRLDERPQMDDDDYVRLRRKNRSQLTAAPKRAEATDIKAVASPADLPAKKPGRKPGRRKAIDPDAGEHTEAKGDWEP